MRPAVLATTPPVRDRPFGDVVGRRHLLDNWRALVCQAGLKGGTRKLRKSSASWVERVAPGSAMSHLGHKTPGLAYRHYVDPRIVGRDRPMPPPLTG